VTLFRLFKGRAQAGSAAARLITAGAFHQYRINELYRGKEVPGFRGRSWGRQCADIIYRGLKAD